MNSLVLQDAFNGLATTDPVAMRGKIEYMKSLMLQHQAIKVPTKYLSTNGLHSRTIFIRKGALLVGKISRFENINIVSMGDISVSTPDGVRRLKAPFEIIGKAGTKRIGYAHEDTVWTSIFPNPTGATDIDELDDLLIIDDFSEGDLIGAELMKLLKLKE